MIKIKESIFIPPTIFNVKKEAPVNFLIDPQEGRLTLRPMDVLVYG
jgi:hypothetical protein